MDATEYGLLLACYLSGQMSLAQFERHKADDAAFAAWAESALAARREGRAE